MGAFAQLRAQAVQRRRLASALERLYAKLEQNATALAAGRLEPYPDGGSERACADG